MSESVFLRVRRNIFGAGIHARKDLSSFRQNALSLSSENLTWNLELEILIECQNWQKERVESSAAANHGIPESLIYNITDVRISNQR